MATLKLEDYDFSGLGDSDAGLTKPLNPTLNLPAIELPEVQPLTAGSPEPAPQESQEEQFDFSGTLPVKKSGRENAVSSGYGKRTDPVTGRKGEFHDGLDLPLDSNTPLKPFGNGEVIFSGTRKGFGKSVGINYGNGITIYLNHLNRTDVEVGDKVTANAILGLSGNTGVSTGPHVHIQAEKDGVSIDPRRIFNEDPNKVGLALTLKGILDDDNVIAESSEDNLDFSGLKQQEQTNQETQQLQQSNELDFSGIAPTTDNGEKDTDVLKFDPATKQDEVSYFKLFKEGFAPHLKEMAQGIEGVNKFQPQKRVKNPNAPGKSITFSIAKSGDEPPSLDTINTELARVLGLSKLNEKFKNDPDFKTGKGTPLVSLPNPIIKKSSDGTTWQVTVPYGVSSGAVELINAYARGGAKAFSAKQKEIAEQSKVYQEDIDKQKQQYDTLQAFRKNHPYLNLLLHPTEPIEHGLEDEALVEIQLMHTISMLPRALGISATDGFDSEAYTNLIKEDAATQLKINEAQASIPQEETLLAKIPRSITSSVTALPRFQAMGQFGSWTLPTMTYLENLHRGNREAALSALPMAVMIGSMHGMEKFISEGGNPLDLFKKSEYANRDLITSIAPEAEGNINYLIASDMANQGGFKLNAINFKNITPFQRQLVLRGTNAIANLGTTAATNPHADLSTYADSLFIGLALPVGKGERGTTRERPTGFGEFGIIKGDAYTLPDGSILLRAPVNESAGLIGRDITTRNAPYVPSIYEERAINPDPLGTIGGREVSRIPSSRQLGTSNVEVSKGVYLPIDQAALNLLDLRRSYEQGTYLQGIPPQTTGKIGKFNVILDQRKQDLLSAIKILDEAIPKETQEYFAKNEASIREAIRTNYEDRIQKEEFILGKKILRKPSDKLSLEDSRPYNPTPRTPTTRKSSINNFVQTARRTMVTVEEAGKRGLEANKANKGTLNMGIDPSDIPYLVQIGIGKLGRKGLNAAEFIGEMVAEHGEDFQKVGMEVYRQARAFVDGVNNLTDLVVSAKVKVPPFPVANYETIKNIFYIGSKYLSDAKEQDIPLDKIIATQDGVRSEGIYKFAQNPTIARDRVDIVGNPEVPKAVKIGDEYYLFDGHHRSSAAKLSGLETIRGRVIDFEEVAKGDVQTRAERAREKFGDIGKDNKWFTQEKQIEVREDFLAPPKSSQLNEGFSASSKWIADNTSRLVQIVGFHVEDAYRRGIEPKINDILSKLRVELGDWVDSIEWKDWNKIFEDSVKFYQTNNADPFFSSLKQNVLEKFPNSLNAESAKALIQKLGTRQELDWTSGLEGWINEKIKNKEKIKKDELIDYIERNQVKIDEVVLGNVTELPSNYKIVKSDKNPAYNYPYEVINEKGEMFGAGNTEAEAKIDALKEINNKPTRYDLKTYTSEKLELEGGENPREVLLQARKKELPSNLRVITGKEYLDLTNDARFYNDEYTLVIDENNEVKGIAFGSGQEGAIRSYFDNFDKQEIYQSSHWSPHENVVAHFRANWRKLVDGVTRVFHGEEFQSDWNQQGRKEGYKLNPEEIKRIEPRLRELDRLHATRRLNDDEFAEYKTLLKQYREGVPKNPFMENSWKELAFKRFLRMAIEDGADGVTWTTAKQQQERYGKILETKDLEYSYKGDGKYTVGVLDKSQDRISIVPELQNKTLEELEPYIGKEFTDMIRNDEGTESRTRPNFKEINGNKINISKGYSDYDTYFVNLAKKIGKKFGAEYSIKEIETQNNIVDKREDFNSLQEALNFFNDSNRYEDEVYFIGEDGKQYTANYPAQIIHSFEQKLPVYRYINDTSKIIEQVHYLEITPKMRDSILKEGQPLYGLSSTEELKPSTPIGIRNKIIGRDIFDTAKSEVLSSIQDITNNENGTGTVPNSGLNPDAFLSQVKLLYKGFTEFKDFAASMIRKYGQKVSPYLETIWNWIKAVDKYTLEAANNREGTFNLGFNPFKKKIFKGEELDVFNDNRSSFGRRVALKTHRGIALAQTEENFGQVYNTLRGLQRTTNSYSSTILEQLSRAVTLLKKDTDQKTAQAIFTRNKEGIVDPAEDARIIARFGLNPEQTRAYHYARAAVSNVLDLRRDQILYREHQNVEHINDQLIAAGLPTGGTPINTRHSELLTQLADAHQKITDIEDYFQQLKDSGYLSLQRLGRYRAELENPNEPAQIPVVVAGKPTAKMMKNPNRFFVDYADTPEDAQKRINEWKEATGLTNKGRILDAHNPNDFQEMSRNMTPGEFEEIIQGAGVRNTPEVQALRAEVYEKFPTMGYQLRRELYPGYRENSEFMIKSIVHQAEVYASSYYNNIGRQEGLRALEATGIEKTDRDLWNVARQYIEDETSTPRYNLADKFAYKGRKFAYLMQLGYDIRQLYLNAFVQPVTQNYNYLARIENPTTGKRLGGIAQVEKMFVKGTKLSLQLAKAAAEEKIGRRKVRSAEFNEFRTIYEQLKREGVIEPEYNKSLLELETEKISDNINTKFKSSTRRFLSKRQQEHWAGGFMRAGELTTRTQMAASLFYAGKKFGLSGDALTDFIVRGVDATQTNPTRGENPYYVRRAGEVGKLFYQFGAFRHMWWENLILNAKSDWKHKSIAATSRTLAPLAIMGGISGLPLTGFAFTLYGLATGKNPDDRLKRWVKNKIADNDFLENMVLYGNIGSSGFSQSVNIQAPVIDTLADQLTQDSWWDKLFTSNVPALMTTKQIGQGLSLLSEGLYNKNFEKSMAGVLQGVMPLTRFKVLNKPFRNFAKAQTGYDSGYKTTSGDTIMSRSKVRSQPGVIIEQMLGITPNEVNDFYTERKYKKLRKSGLGKATRRTLRKVL